MCTNTLRTNLKMCLVVLFKLFFAQRNYKLKLNIFKFLLNGGAVKTKTTKSRVEITQFLVYFMTICMCEVDYFLILSVIKDSELV